MKGNLPFEVFEKQVLRYAQDDNIIDDNIIKVEKAWRIGHAFLFSNLIIAYRASCGGRLHARL
jgi:hypothetical protein